MHSGPRWLSAALPPQEGHNYACRGESRLPLVQRHPRHRCTALDSGTPGAASPETHSWRLPGARKLVNEMRTDTNLARDRGAEPGVANKPTGWNQASTPPPTPPPRMRFLLTLPKKEWRTQDFFVVVFF